MFSGGLLGTPEQSLRQSQSNHGRCCLGNAVFMVQAVIYVAIHGGKQPVTVFDGLQ